MKQDNQFFTDRLDQAILEATRRLADSYGGIAENVPVHYCNQDCNLKVPPKEDCACGASAAVGPVVIVQNTHKESTDQEE